MTNKTVLYEKNDNIAIITLNRPERLNAITQELLSGLIEQLETARKDAGVVGVILTGAGRAFCAGEDLKETSAGKTLEQWVAETDGLQQVQRVILALGKPLIAAVPGYALGGGSPKSSGWARPRSWFLPVILWMPMKPCESVWPTRS